MEFIRPHELRNADLRGESKDGNNYINGFDKEGRPIVYLKKRGKAEDPYKNVQLLVLVLETAIKMMPPGVEKICLILDMGQYTRANSPPLAITRLTLNILSNHYPERLGVAYMINAPWIFNTLWSIVSPFLDTVTRNKVRFASVAETSRDVAKNPLLGGIEKGMLEKVYGGDLEFVYDDDEYWRDIETAISKK
ncbi:CRAL-TRIO domain-containing protein [Chytridium lagenaria]|nr:CRAL-TRIO domain-containing protein [Chytridium lagenaria]